LNKKLQTCTRKNLCKKHNKRSRNCASFWYQFQVSPILCFADEWYGTGN